MGFWDNPVGAIVDAASTAATVATGLLTGVAEIVEDGADAVADELEDAAEAANDWAEGNLPPEAANGVAAVAGITVAAAGGIREAGTSVATGLREASALVAEVASGGWIQGAMQWVSGANRIIHSSDEGAAGSVIKSLADGMTVAEVNSAWSFTDSGPRRFFRLVGGRALVREPGSPNGWREVVPDGADVGISYHRVRVGEFADPRFDMIAADSGRVFAKEIGRSRFWFTMLEPMFRRNPDTPVRSAYFKLDPEQGLPDAPVQDRLDHLAGEDSDHPAALRFPAFRALLGTPIGDSMAVHVDRHLRVWHLIDARPPAGSNNPPTGPRFPPTETVVTYRSSGLLPTTTERRSYRISLVLDIGVGHEHWHEHESTCYGGEMDSLDGPGLGPILAERNVYRFFNGPVDDKGGFIDGTVNYYALCQFVDGDPAPSSRAFGILWLDEQAVLSERWRLLHPADSQFSGFTELIPSAIVQYLRRDAGYHTLRFDQANFWCPFRACSIDASSRMAVTRQVVLVTGADRATGVPEIYSIHFGFGTSDRTWRWRRLPEGFKPPVSAAADKAANGFTIGIREDTTIWLRDDGGEQVWYQKYLPADQGERPDGRDLRLPADLLGQAVARLRASSTSNGAKPQVGYDHPWQRLPVRVFDAAHSHFSHFGVYDVTIDSRSQYYPVTIEEGEDLLKPGDVWADLDRLFVIDQPALDWSELNPVLRSDNPAEVSQALGTELATVAALLASGQLTRGGLRRLVRNLRGTRFVRTLHRRGLFNQRFLFQIIHREPLGWLLLHADKRDDDLLPFTSPSSSTDPVRLHLVRGTDDLTRVAGRSISLRIGAHRRVLSPPRVQRAEITVHYHTTERPHLVSLRFHFVRGASPRSDSPIEENVWRVRIGAMRISPAEPEPVIIFDELRHTAFAPDPEHPGWHLHRWQLDDASDADINAVTTFLTDAGRRAHGTSMWFEDVVGHVSTADELILRNERRPAAPRS